MLQMRHPRAPPSCPAAAPAAAQRAAQPATASCSAAPAARGASLPQQPQARASWLPRSSRRSGGLPASLRWRSHSDRGLRRRQTLPSTPLQTLPQTAGGLQGLSASARCHRELAIFEVPQGNRLCMRCRRTVAYQSLQISEQPQKPGFDCCELCVHHHCRGWQLKEQVCCGLRGLSPPGRRHRVVRHRPLYTAAQPQHPRVCHAMDAAVTSLQRCGAHVA